MARAHGPGFYAIVDPAFCAQRSPMEVAQATLEGGARVLQLRMKQGSDRERVELARALRTLTAAAGVPFIVNDRADVALLVGADGVHLGQDDLSVADARSLLGTKLVGLSTHDAAQARAAVAAGADMIGFGPVFDTTTKERPDPTTGVAALASICAAVQVPVVAIGGLTPERAQAAYAAGATYVAAISSVSQAADMVAQTKAFAPGVTGICGVSGMGGSA